MSARLGEDGVELVVAGGDAVEALEPAEEPLDFAATPVERAVVATRLAPIALRRHDVIRGERGSEAAGGAPHRRGPSAGPARPCAGCGVRAARARLAGRAPSCADRHKVDRP